MNSSPREARFSFREPPTASSAISAVSAASTGRPKRNPWRGHAAAPAPAWLERAEDIRPPLFSSSSASTFSSSALTTIKSVSVVASASFSAIASSAAGVATASKALPSTSSLAAKSSTSSSSLFSSIGSVPTPRVPMVSSPSKSSSTVRSALSSSPPSSIASTRRLLALRGSYRRRRRRLRSRSSDGRPERQLQEPPADERSLAKTNQPQLTCAGHHTASASEVLQLLAAVLPELPMHPTEQLRNKNTAIHQLKCLQGRI